MPKLTIFTPAYNRVHTLPRTYKSLLRQSCKDFLWLIVDDGSTDGTTELVHQWQTQDNGFEIQYIHKDNGGLHTAYNGQAYFINMVEPSLGKELLDLLDSIRWEY